MTGTIPQEITSLSPPPLIQLYDLDLGPIGSTGTFHFVPGALDTGLVQWRGISYQAVPVECEGFEKSGQGSLPTPTIRIARNDVVASAVIAFNDIIGARLIRWQTFKNYLDGQPNANPNVYFPPDIFYFDQKTRHDTVIEWKLAASIDQQGRQIPNRVAVQNFCFWRYRIWTGSTFDYTNATCPYTGGALFDTNDQPTGDPASDKCSKKLSGCIARFGGGQLPMGGFPGMVRPR
jgi:lambda family phage minor tail protein L